MRYIIHTLLSITIFIFLPTFIQSQKATLITNSIPLFVSISQFPSIKQIIRGKETTQEFSSFFQITNQSAFIRVPQDIANIQQAISQVNNNGVIEVANGIYNAPGPEGFEIKNIGKKFTIRAASGATVVFDGGGTNPIISYLNTDPSQGGPINFEGIIFANGRSETNGRGGGVTVYNAQATFTNCIFRDNAGYQSSSGGGGVVIAINSVAVFSNCFWEGNVAKNQGGGLLINDNSSAFVLNSKFINNSTSVFGHRITAAGGAIHVGNSNLIVSNSEFDSNQAGYVGGAIFAVGNWVEPVSSPKTSVIISNSSFSNNRAVRHPSVSSILPTVGGAFHAENQTTVSISDSTFTGNRADSGGGVNLYRAIVTISRSVFKENRAVGSGSGTGFGAAISATSSDANDASTNNGAINRRSATLTVNDTLIQGVEGQKVSQVAGGLYAAGDSNRTYGQNGVSQMGTVEENRARVTLSNVIIDNTRVEELSGAGGTGIGGALVTDLAHLTAQDSLFIRAEALGDTNSSGGSIAIINQSLANLSDVTIARNTVDMFGAGIFGQGSEINVTNCKLFENEISPGTSEPVESSFGAAIYSMPINNKQIPVTGKIEACEVNNNVGLPFFDNDRTNGPINDIRYDSNQIYSTTFGNNVYRNNIVGTKTTSGLNTLTVVRANGQNTKKTQTPNVALSSSPSIGSIAVVPSTFYKVVESISTNSQTYTYYVGYAWSGNSATLDGITLTDKAGVVLVTDAGEAHILKVDGVEYTIKIKIIELDEKVFIPVIFQ